MMPSTFGPSAICVISGGAAPVMLARAHPHGAWVEWLV
jgi:hypothetical protein